MDKLMAKVSQGQPANALKHGELAHQFLRRGQELVEEIRENMVSDQLQHASKMLEDIRNRQKKLLNETKSQSAEGGNAGKPSQGMAQAQKDIRGSFDQFLQNLAKAAQEMEGANPGAVRELSKAMEIGSSSNISGKMKRSENAIRYGRYERAEDYQQQSDASLAQISELMQSAIKQNQTVSNEQLGQMLQQVMNNANRIQKSQENGTSAAEKEDLRMDINKELMDITRRLNDEQMDNISLSMSNLVLGASGSSEDKDSQAIALLYQTAQLLETKLMESAIKKKINLTRVTGQQPPDEYKKLVNEYFKNLSTIN